MSESLVSRKTTGYITREEAVALASTIFNLKSVRAIDFCVAPFSNEKLGFLGEHVLLTIKVKRDVEDCKSTSNHTFFTKLLEPQSSAFNVHVFQEEIYFYTNFVPLLSNFQIDSWSPQCYLVKKNLLVLDNLKSQGYRLANKKLTARQLKAATFAVARFHASSLLLEHQLEMPLKAVFPGFFERKSFKNDNGQNSKFLAAGLEVAESVACDLGLDPKYVSMAYEIVMQRNYLTDTQWNVLCHQDLWINNLMFSKDDENCRLLDFQMVAYASFATDIVQLLHLNLDRTSRLKFEQLCLELYHSVLEEILVFNGIPLHKIISFDEVLETVERKRIFGLFSATLVGPIVFLNKKFSKAYNSISHDNNCRKSFVKEVMRLDSDYQCRVEESIKELVDYMKCLRNET